MKIFLVTEFFWPGVGGLENSTAYLAERLGRDFDVEVLTLSAPSPWVDSAPFPVARFGQDPYPAMGARIAGAPGDKAVAFLGFSDGATERHLALVASARASGARRVFLKVPSLGEFSLYVDRSRLERLRTVDRFLCPNRAIQDELAKAGIERDRTIYRPNGVPCDRFLPASPGEKISARAALGLGDGPVFVFTGRFAARKRVDLLARAFEALRGPTLLLVGYFDDRFDAGSRFRVSDPSRIRVLGPVRDVRPFLRAADVYVSASVAEGMSNSLLEAMACGLPALVSAIPGHADVVSPGESGELFPPDSLEGLVLGVERVLEAWADLPLLGDRARSTVLGAFDIESVARTYRRLLLEDAS